MGGRGRARAGSGCDDIALAIAIGIGTVDGERDAACDVGNAGNTVDDEAEAGVAAEGRRDQGWRQAGHRH